MNSYTRQLQLLHNQFDLSTQVYETPLQHSQFNLIAASVSTKRVQSVTSVYNSPFQVSTEHLARIAA